MNKAEFIEALADKTGFSKADTAALVNALPQVIGKAIKKGDKVSIMGFGSFEVRKRAARTGRNPQTGEQIKIKASKTPVFKAGKAFKDLV